MMVLSLDARVPETDRSRARPESARERVARRTSLEPRAGFALARARRRGRASRAALVDASVAPRATRPAAGIVSAIDARARARAFPEGDGQRRPTRFPSVAAPRTTRADLAAIDRRAALDRAPVATVRRRSTECAARAEDPAGARRKSAELNDRGRRENRRERRGRPVLTHRERGAHWRKRSGGESRYAARVGAEAQEFTAGESRNRTEDF